MNPEIIGTSKEISIAKFVGDHLAKVDPALQEKGVVVTILEGQTREELPLVKPNKVHLGGTISAPAEFYGKRKDLHDKNKCHVLYSILDGKIILVVDENYENDNYKITGKLEKNSELTKFQINSGQTFSPKDLLNQLKFNRIYFSDKTENAKIVTALSQFNAKVTQAFTDTDTLRGDQKQALESKIEHELQESFMLEIALFKGQKKEKFKVDVCLQVRSGGVQVYLESVALKELEMSQAEELIKKELEKFSDIVCIEQ